jgi:hypothetical protein
MKRPRPTRAEKSPRKQFFTIIHMAVVVWMMVIIRITAPAKRNPSSYRTVWSKKAPSEAWAQFPAGKGEHTSKREPYILSIVNFP